MEKKVVGPVSELLKKAAEAISKMSPEAKARLKKQLLSKDSEFAALDRDSSEKNSHHLPRKSPKTV